MFVYNFNKIITINCLQTIKILYLHFLDNAKDTPFGVPLANIL